MAFTLRFRSGIFATLAALAVAAGVLVVVRSVMNARAHVSDRSEVDAGATPLAVLGDSDSHAYHDSLSFPSDSPLRGGAERDRSFQWTEVLAQLRGREISQGAWGERGQAARIARVAGWFGLKLRTPRKQDFAHNFAVSGSTCANLDGKLGQTTELLSLLAREPSRWDRGVVVVRIGINDIGKRPLLDRVAIAGLDAGARDAVAQCVGHIGDAARRIRAAHPKVHIVLVGIADNADWPPNFDAWRSAEAIHNLDALHDAYDNGVRGIAAEVPNSSFFDDRAWFREHWGGRGADGAPAYRPVCMGNVVVTYTQGDELRHAILGDGHAGTVLNALWARALVRHLGQTAGAPIRPIGADELDDYIESLHDGASAMDDPTPTGACAEER